MSVGFRVMRFLFGDEDVLRLMVARSASLPIMIAVEMVKFRVRHIRNSSESQKEDAAREKEGQPGRYVQSAYGDDQSRNEKRQADPGEEFWSLCHNLAFH